MNELALFAGAGGGILGGKLLGWRTVCAVEIELYAISVLIQRQNDKILPTFPIWDDIRTFDGGPWRGIVDVVSGGFPCQDISAAGKGKGIEGSRSGLWKEMARVIGEVQPKYIFIENSPMLRTRGLQVVLKDVAEMGYDAKWGVIAAEEAGAPHKRERMWIKARQSNLFLHSKHDGDGWWQQQSKSVKKTNEELANTNRTGRQKECDERMATNKEKWIPSSILPESSSSRCQFINEWWKAEPDVGRVADGVAARVDRLKAIGNGQVSTVVRLAWNTLNDDTL